MSIESSMVFQIDHQKFAFVGWFSTEVPRLETDASQKAFGKFDRLHNSMLKAL